MPPPEPWVIVVLAAGRGRRMGSPKALMPTPAGPWWRVQESRLAPTGLPRIWVVSPEVAAAVRGIRTVPGAPDAPMFHSVRRGVGAAPPGAGVFVLPVDVPAPRAAVFASLSAAAGSAVALPVRDGVRGHPVALSASWLAGTFAPATGDDLRLDALIGPAAIEVPVDDPAVVTNLNTPEDLERWLAAGSG